MSWISSTSHRLEGASRASDFSRWKLSILGRVPRLASYVFLIFHRSCNSCNSSPRTFQHFSSDMLTTLISLSEEGRLGAQPFHRAEAAVDGGANFSPLWTFPLHLWNPKIFPTTQRENMKSQLLTVFLFYLLFFFLSFSQRQTLFLISWIRRRKEKKPSQKKHE